MSDLSPALIEELVKALYEQNPWTSINHSHEREPIPWEVMVSEGSADRFLNDAAAIAPILSRALTEAAEEGVEKMREAAADLMENLIDGEKVPTDWDDWYESRTIEAIPAAIRAIPNPYLTEKEQRNDD